jgi:hypothetical protein
MTICYAMLRSDMNRTHRQQVPNESEVIAEQTIGHNFSCFFPPEDIQRCRPEKALRLTAASGRHAVQNDRSRSSSALEMISHGSFR